MVCVDVRNGIYVTAKYEHSPVFPIHVIKSTTSQKMDCEVPNCRKFMQIALSSGNPGKECSHLERTSKAKLYIKPGVLNTGSLQDMMSKGLMSTEWGDKCEKLNMAAIQCGVDSVFVEDGEQSKRWHSFSIFTNESDNWCYFGRTRVTFDSVAGQWNCQCRGTGQSHRCVHRMMGMWWIYQELPGTLAGTCDIQVDAISDLESHMLESGLSCEPLNMNDRKICAITEYFKAQKRIPCLQDLPVDLRTKEEQPPLCFEPFENTCPFCPGPTPPALNPSKIATT